MGGAERDGFSDLGADNLGIFVLDAKLHELDADGQEPGEPLRVRNEGIEGIEAEHDAPSVARPITRRGRS
jgi:hypothetical protein